MKRMRVILSTLAAVVLALGPVFAADPPEKAAERAAQSWLALVDAASYGESWKQAAALFKQQVTAEQWETSVRSARSPLGKLSSRKLKSAQYTKTLPGGPDGEYVVLQYDSAFEKKSAATETVTPTRDKDGVWRVAGYYIK